MIRVEAFVVSRINDELKALERLFLVHVDLGCLWLEPQTHVSASSTRAVQGHGITRSVKMKMMDVTTSKGGKDSHPTAGSFLTFI